MSFHRQPRLRSDGMLGSERGNIFLGPRTPALSFYFRPRNVPFVPHPRTSSQFIDAPDRRSRQIDFDWMVESSHEFDHGAMRRAKGGDSRHQPPQ
jgi:hypothetical protein